MLAVPPLTGPQLPPADNSALVALPRLDSMATAEPVQTVAASASPAVLTREPLPQVSTLPLLQSQPPSAQAIAPASLPATVRAEPLPLIQAQPLPAAAPDLSIPPPSFGAVVPSPNPLPGASNSLPPIAGSSTRQVPLPGGNASGFSSGSTGFTQGFR
jgi:DedD protein